MGKKKISAPSPVSKEVRNLAGAVGDFIRYWGFRRIHGQIWTQVYIASKPLSGADLTRQLGVSKALVSPALKELEAYQLIQRAGGDEKTKRFEANPDVFGVIQRVLKEREKKLLVKAKERFKQAQDSRVDAGQVNLERLRQIGEMVESANFAIDWITGMATEEGFSKWAKLD